MIEFKLDSEWGGWSHAAIPDDVEMTIRTSDTTHHMEISLTSLMELYGYVVHEKECDMVVGTGDFIEIIAENGYVRFRKPPLNIRTTFEELEDKLELLLRDVFEAKDNREHVGNREEQLESTQRKLQKKEIEYDVKKLYRRLVSE